MYKSPQDIWDEALAAGLKKRLKPPEKPVLSSPSRARANIGPKAIPLPSAQIIKSAIVNKTPKFQSELYDKTLEAKAKVASSPFKNLDKYTSAEKGALFLNAPGFQERFQDTVASVRAGKVTLPTQKAVKRNEFLRYREGQDFQVASGILSSKSDYDERSYGLVKQGRQLQADLARAGENDYPLITKQLYQVTNDLMGLTDAPAWKDEYLSNPNLLPSMDSILANYEGQNAPLAYAESVVEQAEKLKTEADWLDRVDEPYQAMDAQERLLFQQEAAFAFREGRAPIMFDTPEEYLSLEQNNIDLHGLTDIAPGASEPQYKIIAEKNKAEIRETATVYRDLLASDSPIMKPQARRRAEFELSHLDKQLTAIEGFKYRYENENIKTDAEKGKQMFRDDFHFYAAGFSEKADLSMFNFEDAWALKLGKNPKDEKLQEQYQQEREKLGSAINRSKAGNEILGIKNVKYDYFVVPMMTDQELLTYYGYYANDKQKAHEYALALDQSVNKRAAYYMTDWRQKMASGNIWEQGISAIGSVFNTAAKAISAVGIITKGLTNSVIDPYAAYFDPTMAQQDVRGQLKENTKAAFGEDSIPTKIINFSQDVLFGASDTILGGKTLGFTGYIVSGASDSARSALLRGGNQEQALSLFGAHVASEALTEAIPFHEIMGGMEKGFTWRGLITSIFGETAGEGASSLLGSKADTEIMLDKSFYELEVKELLKTVGTTLEQAAKAAMKTILNEALYEGIVGGFSGGLAYTIATGGKRAPKDTAAEQAEIDKARGPEEISTAIEGILSEFEAGDNAPVADGPETDIEITQLEEDAEADEASHEPDFVPTQTEEETSTGEAQPETGEAPVPALPPLEDTLAKEYPVVNIPVSEIKVSPAEYQFKSNVDETGVKDTIEGKYIPSYAGTVVVHERLDGTKYIADGHHRLALARESGIMELQAIVLREADGVSTAQARAFAAARNIAMSRGTSIDAAKVFMETGVNKDSLFDLGLSPNERNVQEGLALSQVDPALFERIVQEDIPVKVGVILGFEFANDGQMQREFLRKMGPKTLSNDAMVELANVLKNARKIAVSQEQIGFDFMDDPALTNAAEIAEIAARVKNMIARAVSTFKGLSGGKKVDQVSAVGENEIDTQANAAEVVVAQGAVDVMQTYWAADSPALPVISDLATAYAEGRLPLPKAAEQAYTSIMELARSAASAVNVAQAQPIANMGTQMLVGTYGAEAVGPFMSKVLQLVTNTDYDAQQETMKNIRESVMLPVDAQARQILDFMVKEGQISLEVLSAFNTAAREDLANPTYVDNRANIADETSIAIETAKEVQNGTLQEFDERRNVLNAKAQEVMLLQQEVEQLKERAWNVIDSYQQFNKTFEDPNSEISVTNLARRNKLRNKAQDLVDELKKQHKKAVEAANNLAAEQDVFGRDYSAALNEVRQKAIDARSEQGTGANSASPVAVDENPVQEVKPLKTPIKGQSEGVQKMYTDSRNVGIPVSAPIVDYSGPVQSAQTIFTRLGKALKVPFNVNRKQYVREMRGNTAGYFVKKSEAVHVAQAQDLSAAAHEFGHWVDKRTRIGSHPVVAKVVALLEKIPTFRDNYTPAQLREEAVAEVTKMYMVNREETTARLGADFVAELESGLKELGVLKDFDVARLALGRLIGATTAEQIKARILPADTKGKKTLKESVLDLRTKLLDKSLAFDPISQALHDLKGKDYLYSEDPRNIALKNNRVEGFIESNISENLVDMIGDVILPRGFADNFEGINWQQAKDFSHYLLLYHEIDRARAGKSMFSNQYTEQQLRQNIARIENEHPAWKNNKAMLHEWWDAFFKEYVVKQGKITQRQYDHMKDMYPNYVPTYRVMPDGAKDIAAKPFGDIKKGLMAAHQSDLSIKDPIEMMGNLVIAYTNHAHRLQLNNTFADFIDTYDGTGVFAEDIQKDEVFNYDIARIRRQVAEDIARRRQEAQLDDPDFFAENEQNEDLEKFQNRVMSILDNSIFTISDTATGLNVVNILNRFGNYRSYVVHDPNMFAALQSVPPPKLEAFLKGTEKVVRLISMSATGSNPFFVLTNGPRDMVTQMLYGTTSTNFLTMLPKWFINMPKTIAGILSNTTINGKPVIKENRYTEPYRLYKMYSETGARYSAQIKKSSKTMVEALTQPSQAKTIGRGILKTFTLQFLNEIVENNSRFLEFYSGKSALGKNRKNLDTFEGRLRAGLNAAGVTVDFRRSGSAPIMRQLSAFIPFMNPAIQGINKAASIFTAENAGRRTQIVAKIALNMTMLGVLQAVANSMFMTDDEKDEYNAIDEGFKIKNLFLKADNEHLLRIAMTQDPIALTFYGMGRVMGELATGEGDSVADALVNMAKAVLTETTNFSSVYSPINDLIRNRTWYDSMIETYGMEKYNKRERYNERTTGIAKWLANNVLIGGEAPLSPVQWDYVIPQYTGIWGKLGLNLFRNMAGDATIGEAALETLNSELSSRFYTTPAYTTKLYKNYQDSLTGIEQVKAHYAGDRKYVMFDNNLSQAELDAAVTEAMRMLKSGGSLYEINKQISEKWDTYNDALINESLTDAQRETQTVDVRREINKLALQGQNVIAEYESKYFPGRVRTNERAISAGVSNMRTSDIAGAVTMPQTIYDDLQAGQTYAKEYADYSQDIYKKWDNNYILTTKPSLTWKGFDKSATSPAKIAQIERVYFTVVAEGLREQYREILNAATAEEADKLLKAITKEAAARAKEEAFR